MNKEMTVKELINMLSKLDPNLVVCGGDAENNYGWVREVKIVPADIIWGEPPFVLIRTSV